MKTHTRTLSLLSVATVAAASALFVGCSDRDRREVRDETREAVADTRAAANEGWDKTRDAASRTTDRVAAGSSSAWTEVSNYSYDRRAEFRAGVDRLIADLDRETAEWREDAAESTSEARREATLKYREARAELRRQLDKMDRATSENWTEFKADVAEAWRKTQDAFRDAKARMTS